MASSDPRIRNNFSISTPTADSTKRRGDFSGAKLQRDTNINQTIKEYRSVNSAAPTLRFPLTTPKYYMTLDISTYSRSSLFNVNFSREKTIVLPMPNQLLDTNVVEYTDHAAVGPLVGTIVNAGTNIKDAASKPTSAASKTLNSATSELSAAFSNYQVAGKLDADKLKGAFSTVLGGATAIGAELLSTLSGKDNGSLIDNAQNAARAFAGYAPNQFFTVLLVGPKYNTYQFTWAFFPKNFKESQAIQEIYYELNNSKAPDTALGGSIWKFPKIFKLGYHPNNNYLNKFKPSVINSVSINWAPGGAPSFYAGLDGDNPPESVVIQASFLELEYWLKDDYKDGLEFPN